MHPKYCKWMWSCLKSHALRAHADTHTHRHTVVEWETLQAVRQAARYLASAESLMK